MMNPGAFEIIFFFLDGGGGVCDLTWVNDVLSIYLPAKNIIAE